MKKLSPHFHKESFSLIPVLLFLVITFCQCHSPVPDDSIVLDAIKEGDNVKLNEWIRRGLDINREYGSNEITLLNWAIVNDQLTAAYLLEENGADVNRISDEKTPLMYAARFNSPEIAKLLISRGSDINGVNSENSTAFHYAARYNNLEMLELLAGYGADINMVDNNYWTALDYAIVNNRRSMVDYLESIGASIFTKNIGNSFEGPYVYILNPGEISVRYLSHDSSSNKTTIISREIAVNDTHVSFPGIDPDRNNYNIVIDEIIPATRYNAPSRIIAIGDIHGQYDRMVKMLVSAGVVDSELNWSWGDGHLVFNGDIFDRGTAVTEALWLIYKLEKQAIEVNGKVHLLLGNHEVMILDNDKRYIANKYYGLTSNLGIEYNDLFNKESVIGKWIRTKNCVEIIGTTMFVHAGISPQLGNLNLTAEQINYTFREIINNPGDTTNTQLKNLLKGNLGPVWYRGYARSTDTYDKITQEEIEQLLGQYSAEMVVVGHTEFDSVGLINNNTTLHINIPLANDKIVEQALLIEEGSYYRISSDMRKTKLK